MKTHKDLLSLTEEEVRKELRVRHADEVQRVEQEAKRRRLEEIVAEEGLSLPKDTIAEKENEEEEENQHLKSDRQRGRMSGQRRSCDICNRTFSCRQNLWRHKNRSNHYLKLKDF